VKEVKRWEVEFVMERRKKLSRLFTALNLNSDISVGMTAFG
jgi:hypothetical protein